MLSTESEYCSIPSLPAEYSKSHEKENGFEEYNRERSKSFTDMMMENLPSHATIPSPQNRRKAHGNHHKDHRGNHHHHYREHKQVFRSPSSPVVNPHRKHTHDTTPSIRLLSVDMALERRPRSNSDSKVPRASNKDRSPSPTSINGSSLLSTKSYHSPQLIRMKSANDISSPTSNGLNFLSPVGFLSTSPFSSPELQDSLTLVHKNNPMPTCNDNTLTRRAIDLAAELDEKSSKKKTLAMIDSLILQCEGNYQEVESQINFTFLRLSTALDNRRKELIEEAKIIRDRKTESLKKSKTKCVNVSRSISRQGSTCGSNSPVLNEVVSSSPVRRGSIEEQDDILQHNGILEPWRSSSSSEDNTQGQMHKEKRDSQEHGIVDNVFSDILEEGNMEFTFNDEKTEIFNSFGTIKEALSSPQLSFLKGLCKGIAIVGDEVHFEVHTRSRDNEITFNNKDKLEILVSDCDGEKVKVGLYSFLKGKRGNGTISPMPQHNVGSHRVYQPHFIPKKSGEYSIKIMLNDVELDVSPLRYKIYPKMNLTFDLKTPEEKKTEIMTQAFINGSACEVHVPAIDRRRRTMIRRESSEDTDWHGSDWIVQKGDKSTILRSSNDVPSYIYAATVVTGLCAWKLRVTSACASITLSIGVGTRSGIPDIDEHVSCNFNIGQSGTGNANASSFNPNINHIRRSSSFTRVSFTYTVLLNTVDKIVRVICEETDEEKASQIYSNMTKEFSLYPFCSMLHHHENCSMQVCPRPQITLL